MASTPDDQRKAEPSLSESTGQISFSGRSRPLAEALARKSPKNDKALRMYFEALRAMERHQSSEDLHVAGYEFREFMNVLPKVLDVPIVKHYQIRDKVQWFVGEWRKSSISAQISSPEWSKQTRNSVKNIVSLTEKFVVWAEENTPRRKTEVGRILRYLYPASRPMPTPLLDANIQEWSDMLRYFNNIAHHNIEPDRLEFNQKVEQLEVFLLDHLEPRTFDDQDEIDQLIVESEADND